MFTKPFYFISAALVVSGILTVWLLSVSKDGNQSYVNAKQHAEDLSAINQKLDELARLFKQYPVRMTEPQGSIKTADSLPVEDSGSQNATSVISKDEHSDFEPTSSQASGDTLAIESEQQELDRVESIVWAFEREMSSQDDDTRWNPQTEDALYSALESDIFNQSALANVSCRTTMCRIDIAHADQEAETLFLSEINARAGFSDTEAFYTREVDANGGVSMTYYLSREGYRLPQLTAAY